MKNPSLILTVAVLALIAGFWANGLLSPQRMAKPVPLPGFSLPDLAGQTRALSEWDGKVRVINFWATWCPPCREEIPELMALHKDYADQGVVVIGIAIDEPKAVSAYLTETAINYPQLLASDNGVELSRQLGNTAGAVPFTLVVNRHGQIVFRHPGALKKAVLEPIIKPLLP